MGILLMRKSCFTKVLFGGPYKPNVPFELEVFLNEDFNDWNLWQRKTASNWRCPLRFRAPKYGYHIMAIKYTTLNAAIILQLACWNWMGNPEALWTVDWDPHSGVGQLRLNTGKNSLYFVSLLKCNTLCMHQNDSLNVNCGNLGWRI